MLARTIRLKCDGLHDVSKQLLTWIFEEKRKFSTAKVLYTFNDEIDEEYDRRPRNARGNRNGFGYRSSFGDRYNYKYNDGYRRQSGPKFKYNLYEIRNPIDWESKELKPFNKDFYKPHPDVLSRSPEEIKKFLLENDIQIFGQNCPAPILKFEELDLSKDVSNYLSQCNYETPTPIQSQTWPIALSGRDLVGISRTGSGKTLGYILPAIVHIQNQPKLEESEGPIALVLAPTRELVQQIQVVTTPIARACRMRTAALFGGKSKFVQMNEIRDPKEIFVATPGRLLDFLNDNVTNLRRCTYLVLDEADQMLDMGFEPQIRSVIEAIRPDRQVLMWSATWPKDIRNLANDFLKNYIKVQVGSAELSANPNIIQVIHLCEPREKMDLLLNLLHNIEKEPDNKTLIFAQTKIFVERIGRFLRSKGIRVETLHGDHKQSKRNEVMRSFREGFTKILVATNVAGRGLDVNDIKYVINYDFPNTVEEYVHKIGRTARSNDSGTAHTFFTPENASLAQELISVLESSKQVVSPELQELVNVTRRGRYRSGMKNARF